MNIPFDEILEDIVKGLKEDGHNIDDNSEELVGILSKSPRFPEIVGLAFRAIVETEQAQRQTFEQAGIIIKEVLKDEFDKRS